jgi:hypothetical protein
MTLVAPLHVLGKKGSSELPNAQVGIVEASKGHLRAL